MAEKNEAKHLAVIPQARLEPLPMAAVDYNDPKVIEVIKAEICPPGTTETEFRIFIDKCRQSGLNPLLGECFCVPRFSNVKTGPDAWSLVKKNQFQAAEAGMASRAEKFEDYRGIRFGMVHEMDTCEINTGTGEVKHSYNLTGDRGKPLAAWAQVIREGFFFSPDVVYLADMEQRIKGSGKNAGQLTAMWEKPEIMLPKCARAAAFRRAFPTPFSAVYAREELRDDDTRADLEPGSPITPIDQRDTTDKLAERMKGAPKALPVASKSTVDVVPNKPQAVKSTPDPREKEALERLENTLGPELAVATANETMPLGSKPLETEKLPHQVADEKKAAAAAEGPRMVYGGEGVKGELIRSLDGPKIVELMKLGNDKLKTLDERKAAKVNENLGWLKAELERREKAMLADQEKAQDAREPGDDID